MFFFREVESRSIAASVDLIAVFNSTSSFADFHFTSLWLLSEKKERNKKERNKKETKRKTISFLSAPTGMNRKCIVKPDLVISFKHSSLLHSKIKRNAVNIIASHSFNLQSWSRVLSVRTQYITYTYLCAVRALTMVTLPPFPEPMLSAIKEDKINIVRGKEGRKMTW